MADILEMLRNYLGPVVDSEMARAESFNQNPFLMFPNRGFFGKHPNFTNALEGGMLAAAQPVDSETIGSSISSVARNLIGLPEARQQLRLRRALQPLAAAQPLMDIQKLQMQMEEFGLDKRYKNQLINESIARTGQMQHPPADYQDQIIGKDGMIYNIDRRTGKAVPSGVTAPRGKWDTSVQKIATGTEIERTRALLLRAEQALADGDMDTANQLFHEVELTKKLWTSRAGSTSAGGAAGRVSQGVETLDFLQDKIKSLEGQVDEDISALRQEEREIRRFFSNPFSVRMAEAQDPQISARYKERQKAVAQQIKDLKAGKSRISSGLRGLAPEEAARIEQYTDIPSPQTAAKPPAAGKSLTWEELKRKKLGR